MGMAAAAVGAGVLGSVGSAVIGAGAAQSAANTQANADQNALDVQIQGENVATGNLAPFVQIGTGAENQLANLYGIPYAATSNGLSSVTRQGVITPANVNAAVSSPGGSSVMNAAQLAFTQSPDYNFAFNQGMQALERSAAATGTLQSGGQSKAAIEFGQGLASQQYGNYFNRLLGLAQMGQNAAAGQATNSLSAANSQANTLEAQGTARASGTVGAANAITGGLSNIGSSVTQGLVLNKLLGGSANSAYSGGAGLSDIYNTNSMADSLSNNLFGDSSWVSGLG